MTPDEREIIVNRQKVITPDLAAKIRQLRADGVKQLDIAARFGLNKATVNLIIKRRGRWATR